MSAIEARLEEFGPDVPTPPTAGGVNGRELAEGAAHRPGLHVLCISGYTHDGLVHDGRLDEGVRLLQKPFRKADVAC